MEEIEKFNLFFSHIICNIIYRLGISTKIVYRYDYNLIRASFKRKRGLTKHKYN